MLNKFKQLTTVLAVVASLSGSLLTFAQTKNIVEVASGNSSFSTLVAAVKAADLVTTLSGNGPFTVLAPTNEAFNKVPKDVLSKLLLPENKATLSKILTYHVIASKADSATVSKLTSVKTVEGSSIDIKVTDSKVVLNAKSTVVIPDVAASNGVIHAIDSVLIPASVDLTKLTGSASTTMENTKPMGTVRTGGYNLFGIGILSFSLLILILGAYKSLNSNI